jgi:hypothetical protein
LSPIAGWTMNRFKNHEFESVEQNSPISTDSLDENNRSIALPRSRQWT